ncbi:DNA polymerase IV [Serinibacter salmoneus]|uniref:DNA polymerase IV n=1 Tax=Serinibacter salmoneus TaxID=556530 RepID=A0A2A9CZ30_9MICO|nr:DNA polymerase IV [Serinibacter salmoneus]PFG19376.1 DNA polymerase-4 [Serinibacter salmoneus]
MPETPWGSDDAGAPILHLDMDAFFASVELIERPELRGRPVIVGGGERGVVLAATYEARAFGIRSGMPMATARARCRQAIVVQPRREAYRRASARVMGVLADVTPELEQLSVDEAFLDVSGARRRLGSPLEIARALRERIRRELGLVASVGLAASPVVAKIASARAKPDGVLLVPAEATVPFLHSLEVTSLWGVGEATRRALAELGVRTVEELAHTPREMLTSRLGRAQGMRLHALAWGQDDRRLVTSRVERSISSEHTFPRDLRDLEGVARTVLQQSHEVARRLREGGLLAQGVTVKVRAGDFTTLTRSRRLEVATDVATQVHAAARALLASVGMPPSGVRLVGVRADDLVPARGHAVQGALGEDPVAHRDVEAVLDGLSRRFGAGSAGPASLLSRSGTSTARGDIS